MAGPMPRTRYEMLNARYKRLGGRAMCRDCREGGLEWWETTHGKKILLNPSSMANTPPDEDHSIAILHRATCTGKPAEPRSSEPVQQSLFQGTMPQRQQALGALAAACHARCVVLLQDDGMVYSFRPGIPAEDLAHELITAANKIRRDLEAQHAEA